MDGAVLRLKGTWPCLLNRGAQPVLDVRRGQRVGRLSCALLDHFGSIRHELGDPEEAMMARAHWGRPGESAATRRLRIALFFSTVVLVVAVAAILVYLVARSAGIAGLGRAPASVDVADGDLLSNGGADVIGHRPGDRTGGRCPPLGLSGHGVGQGSCR